MSEFVTSVSENTVIWRDLGLSVSGILLKLPTLHSSHWKDDKSVLETSVDLESSVSVSNYCAATLKRAPHQGGFSTLGTTAPTALFPNSMTHQDKQHLR